MESILIHANGPQAKTGYGQQVAQLAPRLKALGYRVGVSAFYGLQACKLDWDGIPIYPVGMDPLGNDVIAGHAADFKADLVLMLMDAWALNPQVLAGLRVAAWMPVDCDPLSVKDAGWLASSGAVPVAFSRHGEKMLTGAGYAPLYVPHGIDCGIFRPGDKAAAREKMGISQDAYVIGMNATNKDALRKAYPEQFTAFANFRKEHPDALLLVHALSHGEGAARDLGHLALRMGIRDAVRFSDQYKYLTGGYSQQDMAVWYAALDLYSGCAYGEGFGLPLIEAQACGVPVITTDGSAMTEMCGPGILINGEPWYHDGHEAWWVRPGASDIAEAYERAFAGDIANAEQAREFALQYDADHVATEFWKPALEELEQA